MSTLRVDLNKITGEKAFSLCTPYLDLYAALNLHTSCIISIFASRDIPYNKTNYQYISDVKQRLLLTSKSFVLIRFSSSLPNESIEAILKRNRGQASLALLPCESFLSHPLHQTKSASNIESRTQGKYYKAFFVHSGWRPFRMMTLSIKNQRYASCNCLNQELFTFCQLLTPKASNMTRPAWEIPQHLIRNIGCVRRACRPSLVGTFGAAKNK